MRSVKTHPRAVMARGVTVPGVRAEAQGEGAGASFLNHAQVTFPPI